MKILISYIVLIIGSIGMVISALINVTSFILNESFLESEQLFFLQAAAILTIAIASILSANERYRKMTENISIKMIKEYILEFIPKKPASIKYIVLGLWIYVLILFVFQFFISDSEVGSVNDIRLFSGLWMFFYCCSICEALWFWQKNDLKT